MAGQNIAMVPERRNLRQAIMTQADFTSAGELANAAAGLSLKMRNGMPEITPIDSITRDELLERAQVRNGEAG